MAVSHIRDSKRGEHYGGGSLDEVIKKHSPLFTEKLGTLSGYKAKIQVDPMAVPRFCKARSVPYSIKVKVEEELTRLVAEGILEPVTFSDWEPLL